MPKRRQERRSVRPRARRQGCVSACITPTRCPAAVPARPRLHPNDTPLRATDPGFRPGAGGASGRAGAPPWEGQAPSTGDVSSVPDVVCTLCVATGTRDMDAAPAAARERLRTAWLGDMDDAGAGAREGRTSNGAAGQAVTSGSCRARRPARAVPAPFGPVRHRPGPGGWPLRRRWPERRRSVAVGPR
ncbi:DUF5133 domain-containing protein [Streptomyces sp. NPDC089795]|uniref:DUF5133 domain-containing protein n=1 Tax=Streptomyces sp. NPDC089795 TaxID=3155297 RepID=UPI00343BA0BB